MADINNLIAHGDRPARWIPWRLLPVLLFMLTAGCVSRPVMLHRAVVYNATPVELRDVSVRHETSGKGGSVSAIMPGQTLDVGFTKQPLLSDRATLKWRFGQGNMQSQSVSLQFDHPRTDLPQTLVYTIHPTGSVTARLEP